MDLTWLPNPLDHGFITMVAIVAGYLLAAGLVLLVTALALYLAWMALSSFTRGVMTSTRGPAPIPVHRPTRGVDD